MKQYNKKDIVGLYFNNGIQCIATVIDEDEHFMYVEKLLGLQLTYDEQNQNPPRVSLEDLTPFAEIHQDGLETRIPHSTILATFNVESRLLAGYKTRTGQNIEIVSSPIISDTIRTR